MKIIKKGVIGAVLVGLLMVIVSQMVFAKQWQPFQFKGNERFEYQVSWQTHDKIKDATYILDLKKSEEKTEIGEDLYEVSYTTRGKLRKEDLGPEAAFGFWSAYGISLNILILNPAYGFFFAQMDLKVGEEMNFYGAGIVKIPGKAYIAGKEGFVCQFLQQVDGKEQLVAEWVIDPELALPIRSRVFENNQVQSEVELISYSQY